MMEKERKRNRQGCLLGERKERSLQEEQDRRLEKNRRIAFWGLQLKYTLAPVFWLYGIVFGILTGMFLFNWFTVVSGAEYEISFLAQLKVLPISLSFFVLVIGVQVIVKMGFERQGKNALALKRIPLSEETIRLLRLGYSFLITVSAFLFHFLLLGWLLFLENVLVPETAYGVSELYPAFHYFMHLYRVYPVTNGLTGIALLIVMMGLSSLAPLAEDVRHDKAATYMIWIISICSSFFFYCFVERKGLLADLGIMLVFSITYIGEVILTYRRRQRNDRAEFTERVE